MKNFVTYCRMPVGRHRDPRLDLGAQQAAIAQFLVGVPEGAVMRDYVEKESGRKSSRPAFIAALADAKATGAMLVIGKVEGLTRNAPFLMGLMEANVDFACCDNPHLNASTLLALASVAFHEAQLISTRTKEALNAKRVRGEALGNLQNLSEEARAKSLVIRKQNAKQAVEPVSTIIAEKRDMDWTYQQIADHLNELQHTTPRGYQWSPIAVRRVSRIDNFLSLLDSDPEPL